MGQPAPAAADPASPSETPPLTPPITPAGLGDGGVVIDAAAADGDDAGHPEVVDATDAQAVPPDGVAAVRWVAFVLGNPVALTAGENLLRRRLQERGFMVQPLPDSTKASETRGAALVLVSNSARGSVVQGNLNDATSALITMKASIMDDLAMVGPTRGSDYDEQDSADLVLLDERHPLAAGLRGTVHTSKLPATMIWGRPGPGALRIARLAADPSKVALFAYEKGAPLLGRTAPARRLAFFATESLIAMATPEGLRLFDAAVDWATR